MKSTESKQSIYLAFGLILTTLVLSFGMAYLAMKPDTELAPNQDASAQEAEMPQMINASEDDDAFIGSADAPVTIIEFSDYQCPYCQKFIQDSYTLLKKDYIDTGKVKLVFRDLPLSFHPNAMPAAEAAECAGENGNEAYFKMHDRLFATQAAWSPLALDDAKEQFVKDAKDLGYDIKACLDSGQMQAEIKKDIADAQSYGFGGTPSFTINGQVLIGAYPYQEFVTLIDKVLQQ